MHIRLLLLVGLIHVNVFGNFIDYYNTINEGEYHMYEGNYELAITNFEVAFNIVDTPHARDVFYLAKCYAQTHQPDLMYNCLEKALGHGLNPERLSWDSLWFLNYQYDNRFKDLIPHFYQPKPIWEDDTAHNAALKLLQTNYKPEYHYYNFKVRRDSTSQEAIEFAKEYDDYAEKMKTLLINTLLTHGIPKRQKGQNIIKPICRQFIRQDLPAYQKIMTLFKTALEKGYISPPYYAKLYIASIPYNEKKNHYGLGLYAFHPKDLETICKRRKAIGLSIYYAMAPEYQNGQKPSPISDHFIKPKIESTSSN